YPDYRYIKTPNKKVNQKYLANLILRTGAYVQNQLPNLAAFLFNKRGRLIQ
ncbi:hypothetical protein DFO70_15013, partial [Cytobacillus firmus]